MSGGITDVDRGLCERPRLGIDDETNRDVLTRRIRRIVETGGYRPVRMAELVDYDRQDNVRTGFGSPWEMLAGRRLFDSDEERLFYLRHALASELVARGVRVNSDVLVAAMVDYEVDRIKRAAEAWSPPALPHTPVNPQPAPGQADLRIFGLERLAEYERSEYESYLVEIARLRDEEEKERQKPKIYSGAATVGPYEYYIGGPFESTVSRAKDALPQLISLILDFTPIIGQLKGVAEAIIGRDVITGRQLADWERGLNALLALIPSARGIFNTGKSGLRLLAGAALKSGQSAEEVYRVTKAASKLSEAEVVAAKQIANGKPVNPAQFEKVAGSLDEMTGAKSRGYRVAAGVIEDGRGVSKAVSSSPINTARKAPGKTVQPTTTAPGVVNRLSRAGIRSEAIAVLERAGVQVTNDLARVLINTRAGIFINNFYKCPGFDLIVKDLVRGPSKKKGALFVVDFVTDAANKIDPKLVKFELPAGITKGAARDSASRFTDLVVTEGGRTLNYEFKAYNKTALTLSVQNPKKMVQLVKDVVMFGRTNIRWVFDSRELSRAYVYKQFRQAIKGDAILAREFGDAAKLEKALDELIVIYPPVPKLLPAAIPLQGTTRPFADDKQRRP